eukprot:EG_transcript_32438
MSKRGPLQQATATTCAVNTPHLQATGASTLGVSAGQKSACQVSACPKEPGMQTTSTKCFGVVGWDRCCQLCHSFWGDMCCENLGLILQFGFGVFNWEAMTEALVGADVTLNAAASGTDHLRRTDGD